MSDSLNNKELVAAGHQFAKTLSSDTPFIDMAKIVSRLAERLDCTTAALHATKAQRDQLAAENRVLKITGKDVVDHWRAAGLGKMEVEMMKCMPELRKALETPVTDSFLAEVRAQGVDMAACALDNVNQFNYANMLDDLAQEIRKGAAQ